jgi:hypothetical protein
MRRKLPLPSQFLILIASSSQPRILDEHYLSDNQSSRCFEFRAQNSVVPLFFGE